MQNPLSYFPAESKLVADIEKAINGEYRAIHCYKQLANQTNNKEMKDRILEIRKDEMRHIKMFSYIYTSLTGMPPQPRITEPCPSDLRSGLLASFKDEQETVDFYHRIARESNIPMINQAFTQAAADEQNHAVWFLYFMTHQ
ncbi:ferritin-like domain-containing protein [Lysinibacillus yapensis]|uniref:Ferritin-like domain-containing protein n=1 Tax=Ureibacillus yapensis TaxID=2304605 RepID=A0A396S958_9BACL|nr:ferritin-like domain-containing protein [Lysinibacillus yapensis]RHW37483.1 ferritin-like domain-containing protein [Lysinibacillus yapensis]